MPILYMPIHYMQGVGGGGGGWGVPVKRSKGYILYVFPFEGCILYMYIYTYSIHTFEGFELYVYLHV